MNEKIYILIVDDDKFSREGLGEKLKQQDFNVETISFHNALDITLNKIENNKLDILLLDIFSADSMPGLEIAKKLNDYREKFKLLFITSLNFDSLSSKERQVFYEAIKLQPSGFIYKDEALETLSKQSLEDLLRGNIMYLLSPKPQKAIIELVMSNTLSASARNNQMLKVLLSTLASINSKYARIANSKYTEDLFNFIRDVSYKSKFGTLPNSSGVYSPTEELFRRYQSLIAPDSANLDTRNAVDWFKRLLINAMEKLTKIEFTLYTENSTDDKKVRKRSAIHSQDLRIRLLALDLGIITWQDLQQELV